jgi:hypothetical protein
MSVIFFGDKLLSLTLYSEVASFILYLENTNSKWTEKEILSVCVWLWDREKKCECICVGVCVKEREKVCFCVIDR